MSLRIEGTNEVKVWTLARPAARNALNQELFDALNDALDAAMNDPRLRAIVLTGDGEYFCAGGDLKELRTKMSEADAKKLGDDGETICRRLGELRVPVIAALSGPAIGGGAELALACDMRIADPRGRIRFRQARLGITTVWVSVARLVTVVGHSNAARLLYTASEVSPLQAKVMGLIDEHVETGAAVDTAKAWAAEIVEGGPNAIAAIKSLLRATRDPFAAIEAPERSAFIESWAGQEHHEAVRALFEGHKPSWARSPESSLAPPSLRRAKK